MASSVFFKFKSQKEPTRVEFDGTGISVFELKREIIIKSGLGDGTDFDLLIYTDDNSEVYDDDTTIIPRSTTVIARRQPAAKPGAGRAARYVTGKMPVAAKNAGRKEQTAKAPASKTSGAALSQMNNAMTEEEKMAAMFAAQTEQWSAQQEELSHQAPVFKPGAKRPVNVPDHEPPNGYICYRCGNKGHWIQSCPTNDDPEFDNRPRVKRTTGIPRSFLQKVDKSDILAQSEGDDSKRPSGIMVNAEGDFVIAEPDKASWEKYQAKAAKSASAFKDNESADKETQSLGLECSIDKRMFIDPTKTPCCQKTFCNDCISNALMDSDFVCPACKTEGVLLDDLQPDEETSKKIREYLKEKEAAKANPPAAASPKMEVKVDETEADATSADLGVNGTPNDTQAKQESHNAEQSEVKAESPSSEKSKSPKPAETDSEQSQETKPDNKDAALSKKRPADELLENPKIPKGPRAMQNQPNINPMMNGGMHGMHAMTGMTGMDGMNGMNNMNGMDMNMMFNGMGMMPNMMGMPNMPNMNMMNMGMGMPNMAMGMGGMPNMMGMPGFNGMNNGFGDGGWGMNGMGNMGNMGMGGNMGGNMGPMNGMNGGFHNGGNGMHYQGGNVGGDDDAYMRKPMNPYRQQNKQRRVRPSDYREL
ncbi:retinoblastoma-binding protein [Cordyceps militaris CM01]|uniref:Retinoblastoma-binding protein n=1 Tax=Cordyceps militaris (strain CM01) TaxID=983644 RepID=G3JNQ0_CORMM|nr:retinoblastoma-binding protein [Cordyceps militaris CM01]EGX89890.1 retinoblastoma-binding protein [Cordyceps militaris CM01]